MNTLVVVSKAAPPATIDGLDFDTYLLGLRSSASPYRIVDRTLIVSGTTEGAGYQSSNREIDDHIAISRSGNWWLVMHSGSGQPLKFPVNAIDAISVHPGNGNT